MNTGTAPAGSFKMLVRVNGAVWSIPNNPYTVPEPGLVPGQGRDIFLVGRAPGPDPITGKILVSVTIDSENTVPERSENNNVAKATTASCK